MTVNFSSAPVYVTRTTTKSLSEAEAKKVTRYIKGEALQDAAPDSFASSAKTNGVFLGLFEGLPFLKFLKNKKVCNAESAKTLTQTTDNLMKNAKDALKNVFHGEGMLTERIANYVKSSNDVKQGYSQVKSAAKLYKKADKLLRKADKLEKAGKSIDALAKKEAAEVIKKDATKQLTKKAVEESAKTAGKLGKFGKFMKSSGAGFMLVLSGVIECFSEVIPTFKELGAKKGIKQAGKSAIKVAGDTAGFIAGEQAGIAIGTAIGTAICPGLGSAAGALIGAIGGFIGGLGGSAIMAKVTGAITGKSEREIAKANEENKAAYQAAHNSSAASELTNSASAKIQQEFDQTGTLSEDSQQVADIIGFKPATNPFSTFA